MIKHLYILWVLLLTGSVSMAHPGVGIVIDSKGTIYYTDLKHVWKIPAKGKKSLAVSNVHTHELYLDEKDNLYGEHLWYNGEQKNTWGHYVWKLSASGKFEKIIPDADGFLHHYSFVRDASGGMYWPDRGSTCQKIIRIDKDGRRTGFGTGCLTNIRWMTVSPQGTLYFLDQFDVKKTDPSGRTITLASQIQESNANLFTRLQPHSQHHVMGMALDKKGQVYIAIAGGNQIKKITPDGTVSVVARTKNPWSPSGVLVTDKGDLYILEYTVGDVFDARVEKISASGIRSLPGTDN